MAANRLVKSSTRLASNYCGNVADGSSTSGYVSRVIPFNEHQKFDSHRRKVLRLYKRAMKTTVEWAWHSRSLEIEIWELTMLRQRFEKHKNESDMVKATALLKAGEEEWWINRHYQPIIAPSAPGGIAHMRHEKYKMAADVLRTWTPEERARYPDVMEKVDKLVQFRHETWEEEMARLDAHEAEVEDRGENITVALPAADKIDGLPPFWWKHATRGHERPHRMEWDWFHGDQHHI